MNKWSTTVSFTQKYLIANELFLNVPRVFLFSRVFAGFGRTRKEVIIYMALIVIMLILNLQTAKISYVVELILLFWILFGYKISSLNFILIKKSPNFH